MPDPIALKRQSLADQVADAVLSIILEQHLGPGDTLPSTGELAERFSVSRTVVREALADLAGRGIIERSQGRESVVASPGSEQLRELLSFRIRKDAIAPSALNELRMPVEVTAARLAAERGTEDRLAVCEAALAQMAAAKTEAGFHEADIAFHRALALASGNELMALVLDALVGLMREYRQRWFRGHRVRNRSREVVYAEHQRIYDAVAKGDGDAAAAAMSEHLKASQKDLDAGR